jgi:hypothetical protein
MDACRILWAKVPIMNPTDRKPMEEGEGFNETPIRREKRQQRRMQPLAKKTRAMETHLWRGLNQLQRALVLLCKAEKKV